MFRGAPSTARPIGNAPRSSDGIAVVYICEALCVPNGPSLLSTRSTRASICG